MRGAWAFTQRHNGTGKGGVSHHDAMTWSGIDRKSALPGADLFSGVYMSYATHQLSGESMQGSSRDFGAGYYATLLSKSGFYLDAGVKYVHSFNHDWLAFSGLSARDYHTNSWLGGVEAGYHYPLTRHAYIEPQAQVVLGKLSGATFHWHDRGLLSPCIARARSRGWGVQGSWRGRTSAMMIGRLRCGQGGIMRRNYGRMAISSFMTMQAICGLRPNVTGAYTTMPALMGR